MRTHVALLSALPRTYEELVAGTTDRSKDYIRTQVLKNLNTPESAWETLRPCLKDQADTLFAWCREAGIPVYERASLQDLADALVHHEIVVIMAHWKGPQVHPKDLPDTVEGITAVGLTTGLGDAIVAGASARTARHALRSKLDDRIASWMDWLDDTVLGVGNMIVGDYYGRCLAREDINATVAALPDCSFVPGARLELYDGLWSARDIASCFPDGWRGVCDFVCCRSLYLSDVVKSYARAGLIRADARALEPKEVLTIVDCTLRKVAAGQQYHMAAHSCEGELI